MPSLMDTAGWLPMSRLAQFAQMPQMPQRGLMGGQMPPPPPQQAPNPYAMLAGWGPAYGPQQMPPIPQQAPQMPQQMPPQAMPYQQVISPQQQADMYYRMRMNARNVNPRSRRIDNTRRSPAGF